MKTAFLVEGSPENPGGYNQVINTVKFLNLNTKHNKDDFEFIANNKSLVKKLQENGINSIFYKKNLLDKVFDYLFDLDLFYNFFIKVNFQHSFVKFLKKRNIDLVFFLSPSKLAFFCNDVNFVINIWDLDHKKNSIFPEHKRDYTFEKREIFLNNVLFKSFKVIVAHNENKKDLVNLYNCEEKQIVVQDFIPYIPNMNEDEVSRLHQDEILLLEDLPKDKKIIIYPATFWAHKNHKYIVDVAYLLKKNDIDDFYFIMCGSNRGTFEYIKELISKNNLDHIIKIFTLISDSMLKKLYEKCYAVVMPTDTGPTNLPLYESMYFKKPIFYSDKILNDKKLNDIILPIDTSDPYSFFVRLNDLESEKILEKIKLGYDYYNKNCSQEKLWKTYINIISEFKKEITKWKN